jgi:hypothetical protein
VALEALDAAWIACAARLGIPVARGGDAYVHWDGARLWVAEPRHLDEDDSLAQLVLHEICHFLVQGRSSRAQPDWGLDNTSLRDEGRERAAVRLQAHLAGAWGLRARLEPTTAVRSFYRALPDDCLGAADAPPGAGAADGESSALARDAALRAAERDTARALAEALAESTRALALPLHRASGAALVDQGDARRCGSCAWRTDGGYCRHAHGRARVDEGERACARHEAQLDCLACGACCRSAFDSVTISSREPVRRRHPELVVYRGSYLELARAGDRCAALDGPPAGPYRCRVYEDRPRPCRDFERSGRHCLTARRRVGLTI